MRNQKSNVANKFPTKALSIENKVVDNSVEG
jgi:hypothetical protein